MDNPRIKVEVVSINGKSALVQYVFDGILKRKYVPFSEIVSNTVSQVALEQGIPYGYNWNEIDIVFDAVKFEKEMHNVGLWTAQDVMSSPQKLWSALHATLADNLSDIIEKAKQYDKRSL